MAAKSGKVLFKVNPRDTSRECSACGHIDKANRDRERFICTECGHFDHAECDSFWRNPVMGGFQASVG
ncbi:MAG: zinc ribbon domain-containing protein [Coleofasciculus sp. B1-GNL1-01]|uniref:zinc ribbon domain-containing protein n=1 Tax=Coleofasciculus sp. B1-GNL1-01 TaxID=3068484 RepID=UPI0033035907